MIKSRNRQKKKNCLRMMVLSEDECFVKCIRSRAVAKKQAGHKWCYNISDASMIGTTTRTKVFEHEHANDIHNLVLNIFSYIYISFVTKK